MAKNVKQHIWHPLTQHKTDPGPLNIKSASGVYLIDESGNKYIDAISSWYTCVYGHNHPDLTQAITQQLDTLDFTMLSGFTHEPAKILAKKLIQLLPQGIEKIFFNDNGSTAIEAAIKMALQYHYNLGNTKDTIIAFEDGFHGDTFGAMSASNLESYKGPFSSFSLNVLRLPVPNQENLDVVIKQLKNYITHHNIAAFIFEPLVQGAAGMKFHSPNALDKLISICKQENIICIADEIMTGFGKTGKNFACYYLNQSPDIICLSKALTGGLFPLSITATTLKVYNAFLDNDIKKAFMHAHTYSGHPLGCAIAIAGITLLTSTFIQEKIKWISENNTLFVTQQKKKFPTLSIRSLGVILAIDLNIDTDRYGNKRDELYQFFLNKNIILRPLGNTIYIVPPYIINQPQLNNLHQALSLCVEKYN